MATILEIISKLREVRKKADKVWSSVDGYYRGISDYRHMNIPDYRNHRVNFNTAPIPYRIAIWCVDLYFMMGAFRTFNTATLVQFNDFLQACLSINNQKLSNSFPYINEEISNQVAGFTTLCNEFTTMMLKYELNKADINLLFEEQAIYLAQNAQFKFSDIISLLNKKSDSLKSTENIADLDNSDDSDDSESERNESGVDLLINLNNRFIETLNLQYRYRPDPQDTESTESIKHHSAKYFSEQFSDRDISLEEVEEYIHAFKNKTFIESFSLNLTEQFKSGQNAAHVIAQGSRSAESPLSQLPYDNLGLIAAGLFSGKNSFKLANKIEKLNEEKEQKKITPDKK